MTYSLWLQLSFVGNLNIISRFYKMLKPLYIFNYILNYKPIYVQMSCVNIIYSITTCNKEN